MPALAAVAFAESSFFPIPPDAMIIPMVIAQPHKAWRIAAVATAASVIGGMFGYAIGYYLYETAGRWLIDFYGLQEGVDSFREQFNRYGFWIILVKGATPIPYKIVTIACGIAHYSIALFILASVVTRGARFFMVAALLRRYGEPIREFIEKRLKLVTMAFVILVALGFVAVRYLP
jgi:membrane protein YqaA with SNARE-associated domain